MVLPVPTLHGAHMAHILIRAILTAQNRFFVQVLRHFPLTEGSNHRNKMIQMTIIKEDAILATVS